MKKRLSKRARMRLKVSGSDGSANRMPMAKQFGVFVLFIWIVIPIFVFALAWIFGGILARVEGWPAMVRLSLALAARKEAPACSRERPAQPGRTSSRSAPGGQRGGPARPGQELARPGAREP
jgi:hypothetical protein